MSKSNYLSYEDAKLFTKTLHLKSYKDWFTYVRSTKRKPFVNCLGQKVPPRPTNIPYNPSKYYTKINEWINFPDFLHYIPKNVKSYWPYEDVKNYAQQHHISSQNHWDKHYATHKPELIHVPRDVEKYYLKTKDWVSWGSFLGHNIVHSTQKKFNYLPAMQARKFLHTQNFTTWAQYRQWWQETKPSFLPFFLKQFYTKTNQFSTFDDFFGRGHLSKMNIITTNISVIYIAKINNIPPNVYKIAIDPQGPASVMCNDYIAVKIFSFDPDNSSQFRYIINNHCRNWSYGDPNFFVVDNISQLVYDLNSVFDCLPNCPGV